MTAGPLWIRGLHWIKRCRARAFGDPDSVARRTPQILDPHFHAESLNLHSERLFRLSICVVGERIQWKDALRGGIMK